MKDAEKRRKRLLEIARTGVHVPQAAFNQVDKETPSRDVREWSWWADVWDRPRTFTWDQDEGQLPHAQSAWDQANKFVQGRKAYQLERDAEKAAREEEMRAAAEAEKKAREDVLTADLRRLYLEQPGTTEASFERALPELLEQRARAAVLAGDARIESPVSRHDILGN